MNKRVFGGYLHKEPGRKQRNKTKLNVYINAEYEHLCFMYEDLNAENHKRTLILFPHILFDLKTTNDHMR